MAQLAQPGLLALPVPLVRPDLPVLPARLELLGLLALLVRLDQRDRLGQRASPVSWGYPVPLGRMALQGRLGLLVPLE